MSNATIPVSRCFAICEDLGLDANWVKEIRIEPTCGSAVVYKKNENGEKYVDLDLGEAATETVEFDVVLEVPA